MSQILAVSKMTEVFEIMTMVSKHFRLCATFEKYCPIVAYITVPLCPTWEGARSIQCNGQCRRIPI